VINNGVAHSDSIPTKNIASWVQEALDSIEFAQGDITTKYGSLRASLGHPTPFILSHIAIGNEDCGKPYYDTNYLAFYNAIRQAYPDIITIANCQQPGNDLPVQSYDVHVYDDPQWFFDNQGTFDSAKRDGTIIFNSEYAVISGSGHRGNMISALAEAAWMTGLERNSDLVQLASYGTLFVNDNDRNWSPAGIVFTSGQVFGTPSHWNQVMFANSFNGIVTSTHKALTNSLDTSGCGQPCPISVSVSIGGIVMANANTVIVHKIVNYGLAPLTITVEISGLPSNATIVPLLDVTLLTGSPLDENDFQNMSRIFPQTMNIAISKPTFIYTFIPNSIYVIRAYTTI